MTPEIIELLTQYPVNEDIVRPPSFSEIATVVGNLKNNKATGEDDLPLDIYKHSGGYLKQAL